MASLGSVNAVDIRIIRRFKFLEPVLAPDLLRKKSLLHAWFGDPEQNFDDAHSLGEPEEICKLINACKILSLEEGIQLKPLCNVHDNHQIQNRFWSAFLPERALPKSLQRSCLPMFPFQVLFTTRQPASLSRNWLKQQLGTDVKDFSVTVDAWLLPAGIASAHFSLYIESAEGYLDPQGILKVKRGLETLPLSYKNKDNDPAPFEGVDSFLEDVMAHLFDLILKERGNTEAINPDYVIYYLRKGCENVTSHWENHGGDLAKLVIGNPEAGKREVEEILAKARHCLLSRPDDLIMIGNEAAIASVDAGLCEEIKERNGSTINGPREAFRNHFVGVVEMAYLVQALEMAYKQRFEQVLTELVEQMNAPILKAVLEGMVEQLIPAGFYATLAESILRTQEKFTHMSSVYGGRNVQWDHRYAEAASILGIPDQEQELKKVVSSVLDKVHTYKTERFTEFEQLFTSLLGILDKSTSLTKTLLSAGKS